MAAAGNLEVTLFMVMSANGVVARKPIENSFEWNSEADRSHFLKKVNEIGTAIMGSNTYRSIGCKPYGQTRFFVLTSRPDRFSAHPQVEFVSGDVRSLYQRFKNEGIERIALLGGPTVNRLFLEAGLVDHIYLTLEPVLLPGDLHLVSGITRQTALQLLSVTAINEQKTLLLHFRVDRENS